MTESFGETLSRALNPASLADFGALAVISLLISAIIVGALGITGAAARSILARLFVLLLALAIFGSIAGYAGGLSREAAVGDIIPAVPGLAGGLAVYLFGIDTSRGATASVALIAFSVALYFGYGFASSLRADSDSDSKIRTACFKLFYDPATYQSPQTMTLAMGPGNARYDQCAAFWKANQ